MLAGILARQRQYERHDGERFLDAVQNARLVANAERYYRIMYYGSRASWNLRDSHMFETLKTLLDYQGPASKAIVWAHNSHVGNAAATEMAIRGEHNLGQLCRAEFGNGAYLIGFGTDSGTVAAASDWDAPMQVMSVRPAMPKSYERQCHAVTEETGDRQFMLSLKSGLAEDLREGLETPRFERAIGVIYRPDSELASHYFQAIFRINSTSTYGSTRRRRLRLSLQRTWKACPTPIRSGYKSRKRFRLRYNFCGGGITMSHATNAALPASDRQSPFWAPCERGSLSRRNG